MYLYISDNKCIPTDSKAVGAAWLQKKSGEGDQRQKTTRYDEVNNVVERLAIKT